MSIKHPRHRFGLSLCLGLAINDGAIRVDKDTVNNIQDNRAYPKLKKVNVSGFSINRYIQQVLNPLQFKEYPIANKREDIKTYLFKTNKFPASTKDITE